MPAKKIVNQIFENQKKEITDRTPDIGYFDPNVVKRVVRVTCKFCGNKVYIGMAHRHGDGYVCEECWDERLKPLDLTRTAAALDAYDDYYDNHWSKELGAAKTHAEATAVMKKEADLGQAVGIAFGLDTADRNSMDTCKQCVRPGTKNPPLGYQESWLRKIVAEWRKSKTK